MFYKNLLILRYKNRIMAKKKKKVYGLNLDEDIVDALREFGIAENRSLSSYVGFILREHYNKRIGIVKVDVKPTEVSVEVDMMKKAMRAIGLKYRD